MLLCCPTSQAGQLGSLVGDGRSDSAPMKPAGIGHNIIEVKVGWNGLRDGGMSTVIDHLARPHGGSRLCIVKPDATAAASHKLRMNSILPQSVNGYLAKFVPRKLRYEAGLMPVVRQTHGYIGLATAGNDTKSI